MTAEPVREQYRKLPGHRRGLLRGASLWLGSDHLLSVKSLRFREEYKRFHFRDVQAIVVVKTPRFHVSTRAILVGWLWLTLFAATREIAPWVPAAVGSAGVCLLIGWLYLSYAASCRCRIHTAVSHEELPSIYRTWNARKLLAELEPRIRQVQGALSPDWTELLEARDTVAAAPPPTPPPPLPESAPDRVPVPPPPRPAPPGPQAPGRNRTLITDIFVTSLFGDAALNLATLHTLTKTLQWVWYLLAFAQVAGAILIFLQRYRGILRAGMQKLAIATLIAMGANYYFRQVVEGVARAGVGKATIPDPTALDNFAAYVVVRQVDAGISLVLGIIGVALALGAGNQESES